jgi:hypothetical protein
MRFTPAERQAMIAVIENFPAELEALVQDLSDADLRTHYLEHEWTIAQNVHHVADSHMNSFIRLKLALTEDTPTIKPYDQDAWAVTADYDPPIAVSLGLLRGLHERWCILWNSLDDSQWVRSFRHPQLGLLTLEDHLEVYRDHCWAHLDQIQRTLAAKPSV